MRVRMEQMTKIQSIQFGVHQTRGQDLGKIEEFQRKALPLYDEWAAQAGGDRFLFGTEDLTLLDIHCASIWEMIYLWDGGVY